MLELRPSCEHCDKPLPPQAVDARICSFECTFCAVCVEQVLDNVCPNCGGGFAPRPVRPAHDWQAGNCLANHPAATRIRHRPVDAGHHALLRARVAGIAPEAR